MRVILLTHGGVGPLIRRLSKLDNVELAAVFVETAVTPKRSAVEKFKRSLKYDGLAATLGKFLPFGKRSGAVENAVNDDTSDAAKECSVPIHFVENFHSEASITQMNEFDADLGIIYGTNIIRENVFSIPKLGSINLHQGLAPYYRGGPPVFWELFNDEPEVGITVHFVAPAVDTGDIIHQVTVPLNYDEKYGTDHEAFIEDYRVGLKIRSMELVEEAVKMIADGTFERRKQDTSLGKRYRLPVKKEKDEMKRRLRKRSKRDTNE